MTGSVEVKDFITGISVLVSSILFVANMIFNRKKDIENERHKARISRREELVKSFLSVYHIIQETKGKVSEREPEYTKEWLRLASLMFLFGTK